MSLWPQASWKVMWTVFAPASQQFTNDWWKETKAENLSLELIWFQPPSPSSPPPLFLSFSVTGRGSSPPLAQRTLNGSCMFCWVPSSRTWAAWRCPPRRGPWPPGEPGPSGCPPSLGRPLWRTWRAPSPCWKTKVHALSFSLPQKMEEVTGGGWGGVSLTSSTPPSDTAGSETQHPQTGSRWTEPPQVCSVRWDLPNRRDYLTSCIVDSRSYGEKSEQAHIYVEIQNSSS